MYGLGIIELILIAMVVMLIYFVLPQLPRQ